MPTSLTESDVFTSPVLAPLDTEAATSASILQFAQPLANRTTKHENDIHVRGVPKIRQGSMGAMATATGVQDGDVWLVYDGAALNGVYVFVDDGAGLSATPPDGVMVVASAGMGGTNKWFNALFSLFNNTIGIPKIVAGKILSSLVPYGHVSSMFIAPGQFTTTVLWATDPAHELFNFTPGPTSISDILSLEISAVASCGANFQTSAWLSLNAGANYFLMSPDTGGGVSPPTYESANAGHNQAVSLGFSTTCWANSVGSARVSIRGCVMSGSNTLTLQVGAGRIKIERP